MQEERSTSPCAVQPVLETTGKPVSPLRARMQALMTQRGFVAGTQTAYIRGVLGFVRYCGGRKPQDIPVAEARAYVARLKGPGVSKAVRSNALAALRFLYDFQNQHHHFLRKFELYFRFPPYPFQCLM